MNVKRDIVVDASGRICSIAKPDAVQDASGRIVTALPIHATLFRPQPQTVRTVPPARTKRQATTQADCIHLGAATGDEVECTVCNKRTMLKILACELFVTCTVARVVTGLACCATCKEYKPKPKGEP